MSDQITNFDYDVFISYSSRNAAWVRGELLPQLDTAGLKTFIDFRDFEIGAPSINEMERGVLTSRRTLLVLTPVYLNSEWTEFENLMLQTLDPANRARRLIPLLKERCELPLRIRMLTYVDFTDSSDLDLAWQKLLRGLAAPNLMIKSPDASTTTSTSLSATSSSATAGLVQLRQVLAYLFSDQRTVQRLAADAKLANHVLDWSGTVVDNWRVVLVEAQKQGVLGTLLALAKAEYPNNPDLAKAIAEVQS
ncbi:MAG: TIR domain-containing protein [Caldilineaceae bacterium]